MTRMVAWRRVQVLRAAPFLGIGYKKAMKLPKSATKLMGSPLLPRRAQGAVCGLLVATGILLGCSGGVTNLGLTVLGYDIDEMVERLDQRYLEDYRKEHGGRDPPPLELPVGFQRPRIKPWVLCGWHYKDTTLQKKIHNTQKKIADLEYQSWVLLKHKPLTGSQLAREWGPLAFFRKDPVEARQKRLGYLAEQINELEIQKSGYKKELHDHKEYLKKNWRPLSSKSMNSETRPIHRYPSDSQLFDDQPAMADRPCPHTREYEMWKIRQKIQGPILWFLNEVVGSIFRPAQTNANGYSWAGCPWAGEDRRHRPEPVYTDPEAEKYHKMHANWPDKLRDSNSS
ncbi:hypothetical protein AAMO2058_001286000 [Amorphochlora amoebiformis]